MDRSEKQEFVSHIRGLLGAASLIVVLQQSGMTVAQSTALRRDMRLAGAEFKVMKNTLARIAITDTPLQGLSSFLTGPVAIAYSTDPLAAAKVSVKYAGMYGEQLKIVGGYLNGQLLSYQNVDALAKLPSLDELRSKILAVIQAPATKLAILLKEPGARIARVTANKC